MSLAMNFLSPPLKLEFKETWSVHPKIPTTFTSSTNSSRLVNMKPIMAEPLIASSTIWEWKLLESYIVILVCCLLV